MIKKIVYFILIIISIPVIPYLYFHIGSYFDTLETSHKFTIFRDDHGIPRVVAKDKISLFYGVGYAQGQDRLWTISVKKAITLGRLS